MKYKKIDPNAPPQDNGAAELKKVRIKRGLLTAGGFVVLMGRLSRSNGSRSIRYISAQ